MNMEAETSGPSSRPPVLSRLLAQTVATLLLALPAVALQRLQCWALFVLVALLAWPVWVYGSEVALFERRMWLHHLARAQSGLERWLWRGSITRVLQAFWALVMVAALVVFAARLDARHWAIIAADVLLLSLLVEPVRRGLGGQIEDHRVGIAARRWPLLWINLGVLTLCFALVDLFTASPDTRAQPWDRIAEQAFRTEGLGAACPPPGWARGTLASAEALTRRAQQLVIPSLPDRFLKVLAWLLILGHAGALAYLYTRLQLGVIALMERRAWKGGKDEDGMGLAFLYTILALAIPYIYASSRLAGVDPEALTREAVRAAALLDPCRVAPEAKTKLFAELDVELDLARIQAKEEVATEVSTGLDQVFGRLESGVDSYLDWYFTVVGEYERLVAVASGDFAATMAAKLEEYLFRDTGFADALQTLNQSVETKASQAIKLAAAGLETQARDGFNRDSCAAVGADLAALTQGALLQAALPGLDRDGNRTAVAAGSGALAGAVAIKALAKKTTTAVAAKLGTKQGLKTAVALVGKAATKKGVSAAAAAAGGAALCSPGGPVAIVCGLAAGGIVWLTVDKVMIEIDKYRLHDQMKAELMESLREQKEALGKSLVQLHWRAIDQQASNMQQELNRVFIPARDGL